MRILICYDDPEDNSPPAIEANRDRVADLASAFIDSVEGPHLGYGYFETLKILLLKGGHY